MKKILVLGLTLVIALSMSACGGKNDDGEKSKQVNQSSEQNIANRAEENENKGNSPRVDILDFSTEKGSIKYVGIEKADSSVVKDDNGVLVKYEFTNKQADPASAQNTFGYTYFQNGVEVDTYHSFTVVGNQYDYHKRFSGAVMNGATASVGDYVKLSDHSPLTIMVKDYQTDEYQMMEISVSEIFGE